MSNPSPAPSSAISFENALEKLQQTVKQLESGELTLDQSLQAFEEGVKLTRACQEQLGAADQRVDLLMKTPTAASGKFSDVETQPLSRASAPKTGSRSSEE